MQTLGCNITLPLAGTATGLLRTQRRASVEVTTSAKRDGRGDLVDEGMLQLRARIREVERAEGHPTTTTTTTGWMAWKKSYYEGGAYDEDVVKAVGLLQRFLLDMRPSVAAAVVAAVLLSVSTMGVAVAALVVAMVKVVLGSS